MKILLNENSTYKSEKSLDYQFPTKSEKSRFWADYSGEKKSERKLLKKSSEKLKKKKKWRKFFKKLF